MRLEASISLKYITFCYSNDGSDALFKREITARLLGKVPQLITQIKPFSEEMVIQKCLYNAGISHACYEVLQTYKKIHVK